MDSKEELLHWADEKEVVKSSRAIKLLFRLFDVLPGWMVRALIYPVSFFYFIFSKRARDDTKLYQKNLREYTGGKIPAKVSSYRQILSFSLCVLEKMEGWLGNVSLDKIEFQDDDVVGLINQLEDFHGAVIIGSHLGNIELLRSLSSWNRTKVSRNVPVTAIMELHSTEQFNRTLQEVNPGVGFNVISPSDISPETICTLIDNVEAGGLVVITGDRTSARSRDRILKRKFLGKDAAFPYGCFLLPALIKAPVYFMFGMRERTSIFDPKYKMYVRKAEADFDCPRNLREEQINSLCDEFVALLEEFCCMYPYQWYNFYNFWMMP